MTRRYPMLIVLALIAAASAILPAQGPPADIILTNGKIVTVDERFSIAQAVAIQGDRIVRRRHRPGDRTARRARHAPHRSARPRGDSRPHRQPHAPGARRHARGSGRCGWDGVGSRKQALDLLRARVKTTPAGEWIYTLGGWAVDQFADDTPAADARRARSRRASQPRAAAGVLLRRLSEQPRAGGAGHRRTTPRVGRAGCLRPADRRHRAKPASGAGRRGCRWRPGEQLEASTRQMIRDLNKAGLTAFGSAGCEADILPIFRRLAEQRAAQRARVLHHRAAPAARSRSAICCCRGSGMKLFQGDSDIDHVAYGEERLRPAARPDVHPDARTRSPSSWRSGAASSPRLRRRGLPLHVHANLTDTIDAFLDQIEAVQPRASDQRTCAGRWRTSTSSTRRSCSG